jgi:hypothetical protein
MLGIVVVVVPAAIVKEGECFDNPSVGTRLLRQLQAIPSNA